MEKVQVETCGPQCNCCMQSDQTFGVSKPGCSSLRAGQAFGLQHSLVTHLCYTQTLVPCMGPCLVHSCAHVWQTLGINFVLVKPAALS